MGRFLTSGNGGGSGGASATPAIFTTVVAGEDVQQGDILTQSADGLAYWANDPSKTALGAALRPVYAQLGLAGGLSGLANVASLSAIQQVQSAPGAKSAVLSNGNVVHVWGTTNPPWSAYYMITDPSGGIVVPPTSGPGNSSNAYIGLCALVGGGFVLSTCSQAAGGNTNFTIYDNNGAITTATTRFGSGGQVGTGSYDVMQLMGLANGNFVMVADLFGGTTNVPFMGLFTPAGATVVVPAALTAQGSGSIGSGTTSIVQLTGGGFGIAYSSGAAGGNCTAHFATFNAAGVQQGATTNGRNPISGLGGMQSVALANGGWMGFEVTSGSWPYAYVFNAAGVQQGATNTTIDVSAPYACQIGKPALLSSGNVFLAYTGASSANGICGVVLSPAGTVLVSTLAGALATGTNGTLPVVMAFGVDSVVLYSGTGTSVAYLKYSTAGTAPAINSVQPSTAISAGGAINGLRLLPATFPSQPSSISTFMVVAFQATQINIEGRFVLRTAQTPLGVAAASASKGSAVPVQITGNATLRVGFAQPYAVDANAGSPPGQRMSIVGNQAMLSGVQAPSGRRQIN